jgi:hypothetical protein
MKGPVHGPDGAEPEPDPLNAFNRFSGKGGPDRTGPRRATGESSSSTHHTYKRLKS